MCVEPRVAASANHLKLTIPISSLHIENVLASGYAALTSGNPPASTAHSRYVVRVPTPLGVVPRASASVRKPDPSMSLGGVGRFATAASSKVSSPLAPIPDSALREIFRSALAAERTGETRPSSFSRAAAGGGHTEKVPAAARASIKQLFRGLLRSGLLQLSNPGPENLRAGGNKRQELSDQQQRSSADSRYQVQSALRRSDVQDRQIAIAGRREARRRISFNFLTEIYNEADLYARWGASAQLVKSAGVKGLRPPGAHLRGGIADASPRPMNYDEFRAFVELVRLRLEEQEGGLLPFWREAQSS